MNILEKLSPQQARALQRWYLISCILFTATLFTMAGVHSYTLYTLSYQRSPIAPAQPIPAASASQEETQQIEEITQQLTELEQLKSGQQALPKLLETSINTLPATAYLTKLVIQPPQFNCEGSAPDAETVATYVQQLAQQELKDVHIAQLSQEKDRVTFIIQAGY